MSASGSYFYPVMQSPFLPIKLPFATQAGLPASAQSGSVVWVTDLKTAAIYGPMGWMRIVTGSL